MTVKTPVRVILLLLVSVAAGAESTLPAPGSAALVEDSAHWDGTTVAFTGEAIGEAMRRGGMAWLHLNDDAYGVSGQQELAGYNSGIGIWVDAGLAGGVRVFGDYGHRGDLVEVTGTFHAACPEHGGDLDIHAVSLRVVCAGHGVAHPVGRSRLLAACAMAGVTAALVFARLQRRRRGRRPS